MEQQGMLLEAQDILIEVLSERFGSVSIELSEQIKSIKSRDKLKKLLRLSLRVKNFREFGKRFKTVKSKIYLESYCAMAFEAKPVSKELSLFCGKWVDDIFQTHLSRRLQYSF